LDQVAIRHGTKNNIKKVDWRLMENGSLENQDRDGKILFHN
jgi:hypothetical protein